MEPAHTIPSGWGLDAETKFDLIIDARSPQEYEEDHIPGAENLPVVEQAEYAEVGTLHRTDTYSAYSLGVGYALRNMARHLPAITNRLNRQSRVLVYCFRGGKRSKLWADTLSTVGLKVSVLPGGWKRYRKWVNEQLDTLPRQFQYHVLTGPTGCGKTRLLSALARAKAQVLDLEALANHRGSLIGALPGPIGAQPAQKWFDSQVIDALRRFDPSKPVWVEAESRKIGQRQIPLSLYQAMGDSSSTLYEVSSGMPARVQLWMEDYAHHAQDPLRMVSQLEPIRPLVGGDEYALWMKLASERRSPELFERIMVHHYDPAYQRSTRSHYPHLANAQALVLDELSSERLDQQAANLVKHAGGNCDATALV